VVLREVDAKEWHAANESATRATRPGTWHPCVMAATVPKDLDFADDAPVIAERVGVVSATPKEVWDVLCDHESWVRWFPKVKGCVATSDPGSGVGSTRDVTLPGGITISERFIAWEEPRVWAFTATALPAPVESLVECITLRPLDDNRTEVTYRMAFGPRRPFTPLMKLASGSMGKNLEQALRQLEVEVASRR